MLEKDTLVKITNRDNGVVGYSVPDLGVHRNFQPGETKEITVEEIRKLSYLPGGMNILNRRLIIKNDELLREILGEVEPEYFYSEEDVKNLLLNGSLEQLLDCLDFAPEGVIDLVKDYAVKLKIDNMSKRKVIQEKTGLNITKAIEINEETAEDGKEETKTRRAAPVTEKKAESDAPQRRASAPKYNVVSQQ